jgi:hypothetical protein
MERLTPEISQISLVIERGSAYIPVCEREEFAMKIELKNVKISKRQSHETTCFVASVYVDGEKVGSVQNDGQGGMCRFSPPRLTDSIGAFAKTLPQYASRVRDMSDYARAVMAADYLVTDLLENA